MRTRIIKRFFNRPRVESIPNLKSFLNQPASLVSEQQSDYLEVKPDLVSKRFMIKTYGCAMNENDSEIVRTILTGQKMELETELSKSDVVLINTCAIRENAESKIWQLLNELSKVKQERLKEGKQFFIGVLGCMAERLKQKIVEEKKAVDLIVGPDSYKDLPRLLEYLFSSLNAENNNYAINVHLSMDETYADVIPVRKDQTAAFVSIMRGCANLCSFCIVPFTRGIERSRPVDSVVEEVKQLRDSGIKEVMLLGQNVNSYHDTSAEVFYPHINSKGFSENYKARNKSGLRFAQLLEKVAQEAPEVRFRFTSPHPKDFPDPVLDVIAGFNNVCKQIHMPAQSGNTNILKKMNRLYTREAYLELVNHIRRKIPGVALSSDFIVGFCGETDEEFNDTATLVEKVKFDQAFMFEYSMREKTAAHRKYQDDVAPEVKNRRLRTLVDVFRENQLLLSRQQIGNTHIVLVDGQGRKKGQIKGKTDTYKPAVFEGGPAEDIKFGDYVKMKVTDANSQTLFGEYVGHTSVKDFFEQSNGRPFIRN